jgi:hypothetical protein
MQGLCKSLGGSASRHTHAPPPNPAASPLSDTDVSVGACSTLHLNDCKSNSDLNNPSSAINLIYTSIVILSAWPCLELWSLLGEEEEEEEEEGEEEVVVGVEKVLCGGGDWEEEG